jgi:hypothetical protein
MKCRVCGYELDPNRAYCGMCGTKAVISATPGASIEKAADAAGFVQASPPVAPAAGESREESLRENAASVNKPRLEFEGYIVPEQNQPVHTQQPTAFTGYAQPLQPDFAPHAPTQESSRTFVPSAQQAQFYAPQASQPTPAPTYIQTPQPGFPSAYQQAPQSVYSPAYQQAPQPGFPPAYPQSPQPGFPPTYQQIPQPVSAPAYMQASQQAPAPIYTQTTQSGFSQAYQQAPQSGYPPIYQQAPPQPASPPAYAQQAYQPSAPKAPEGGRPPIDTSEFSWNVYDFPKPKEPGDIPIKWPEYDYVDPAAGTFATPDGRIQAPPQPPENKPPVIIVSGNTSEGFLTAPEQKDIAWKAPMDESNRSNEKFFTFQKKNEEFQRLLDREYEKLQSRKEGETYREEKFSMPQEDLQAQRNAQLQAVMQAQQARNMQGFVPSPMYQQPQIQPQQAYPPQPSQQTSSAQYMPSTPVYKAESINEFERMLIDNTKDAASVTGDTLPLNLEKIQEEVRAQEAARLKQNEEAYRVQQDIQHRAEEEARSIAFKKELERLSSEEEKTLNPPEAIPEHPPLIQLSDEEKPDAMAKAREEYFHSISGLFADGSSSAVPSPAPGAAEEKIEAAADVDITEEKTEVTSDVEFTSVPVPAPIQEPQIVHAPRPEDKRTKASLETTSLEKPIDELFAPIEEEIKSNGKKDKGRKRHGFLKFLLALVLIIALAEAAVVGMRMLIPQSEITIQATQIEQRVINTTLDVAQTVKIFVIDTLEDLGVIKPGEEQDETPLEEPAFDLRKIVAAYNKNIQSITESPTLVYESSAAYEVDGLGDMEVLADDDIKEALYACLISFNSKWVDYVNGGEDDSCLELLKADGAAYRSALNFSKVGQIQEEFQSLMLGQVRTSENAYYVFARELISVTEGGKTTSKAYSWVYQLEDVAGEMKIVDYTPF